MDDQNGGLISSVTKWLQHPFNTQGSALNWILFVGLLAIAIWWWNHVLLQINQEI